MVVEKSNNFTDRSSEPPAQTKRGTVEFCVCFSVKNYAANQGLWAENLNARRSREGGAAVFPLVSRDKTGRNSLKPGRIRLGVRKMFLTRGAVRHWSELPREMGMA